MTDPPGRVQSVGVSLALREQLTEGGPAVLLLHGLGSDVTGTWERSGWLAMLERAGIGWLAPDLRGHGASEKPHEPAAYRLATLVDDAVAVLDAAGLEQPAVIGYSLGSRIALELAATHPERVSRLVLGGFGERSESAIPLEQLLERLPPNVDRDAVRACAQGAHTGMLPLARVSVPVLLVAGEEDHFAGSIETLAAQLADARSERVRGRNHFTTLSARAFKDSAQTFLAELR